MILKCRYYFANISATKIPIFMKFETLAPKVVMNYHNNFCKDPCINALTRGVNVRARVSSHIHTFRPRVRVFMHGSLRKLLWQFITTLGAQVSNFIKIGAFIAEIFAKQYRHFKINKFQCILANIHFNAPKKLLKWIISQQLQNFLESIYQNVLI